MAIEDTKKRFFEVFANGGQFSKATKDFENTLEAQVSFVEDGYFRFRQAASQPLFAGLKQQLIDLVGNFKENDKQLKALAKSIGEGLAKAFKNIEKAIKFLAKNMDNLITAFKIFIGLKIGTFITGLVAQFALFTTAVRGATISFHALNVAIRANPIGILLTVIQAAVVGIILFHKELVELGNKAINFVIRQIDKLKLKFFQLVHFFNKIPGVNIDVSSNIDELEEKIFQSLHKFDEEVPEIRVAVHADYSELDDLEADVGAAAQTTTEKTSEMFEGLKKGIQEAMTSANDTLIASTHSESAISR